MSRPDRPSRRITAISLAAAIAFAVFGLYPQPNSGATTPPGPMVPPLGWQEDITEGFDPPIERVLVEEWRVRDEDVSRYAEQWGKAAFEVLEKRWNDERWRGYRTQLLRFMVAVNAARTHTFMGERFVEFTVRKKLDRPETAPFIIIINQMYETSPETLQMLTREHAMGAVPQVQDVLIHNVLGRSPGKETLDLLRRLLNAADTPNRQYSIQSVLDRVAGVMRAREPMEFVLKAEGGLKQ